MAIMMRFIVGFHESATTPNKEHDIMTKLIAASVMTAFTATAYVGIPLDEHAATNRMFTGIPSMAVSPGGRLWATWYAGPTPDEDHNNYVPLSTSGDNGKTWTEVLIADPDAGGPFRSFDPQLWVTPEGRMLWTWTERKGGDSATDQLWLTEIANPDDASPSFSVPRVIDCGVMMGKPLTLSTGEWVLPVCDWYADPSSRIVISRDRGATWEKRGGATGPKGDRLYDEHQFLERKDGSLLVMTRTRSGIRESVSTDLGKTWAPLEPSKVKHTSARFFLRRLESGRVLLVKHGPVGEDVGRSLLTAYLSEDDGATWIGGLLLDERNGVSYPDGQQTPDGLIRVVYDFSRTGEQSILMATFREEDVLSGNAGSPSVALRQRVSKGSMERLLPVEANADGAALDTGARGAVAVEGVQARKLTPGAKLFTDRDYTLAQWPEAWGGATFLNVPMNGDKAMRCTRAGVVLMLTPTAGRNRDSQTARLLSQGFEKVAHPEIRLFGLGMGAVNFCTVYQKRCAEDEVIQFGKWALPVMLP